jgi:hypothetical protein
MLSRLEGERWKEMLHGEGGTRRLGVGYFGVRELRFVISREIRLATGSI